MTPREKDREIALRMGCKVVGDDDFYPGPRCTCEFGLHNVTATEWHGLESRFGETRGPLKRYTQDWNAAMEVRDWVNKTFDANAQDDFLCRLFEKYGWEKTVLGVTPEDIVDAALEATR